MKTFGLIGRHLTHSFSPTYFQEKFEKEGIKNCQYLLFPLADISEVQALLQKEKNLNGLNITIPYKTAIIPFLDELSPAAQQVGAVNTIEFKDGKRIGHNTDIIGFQRSIERYLTPKLRASKALVLGTGGASKAVLYVLKELGIACELVSRTKNEGFLYQDINKAILEEYLILINTTPLGMYPDIESCALIPYEMITSEHLLFDLVYNPLQTVFMKHGRDKGAVVINGLEMLEQQAEKAWEIWNADVAV